MVTMRHDRYEGLEADAASERLAEWESLHGIVECWQCHIETEMQFGEYCRHCAELHREERFICDGCWKRHDCEEE